jgi:hypothetical protein
MQILYFCCYYFRRSLHTFTYRSQANKNDLDSVLKDIDTLIPTKSTPTTTPPSHNEIDSTTPGNGPLQTSPHVGHTDTTKLAPRRSFLYSILFLFPSSLLCFIRNKFLFPPTFPTLFTLYIRKFNLAIQANVIQIDIPPKVLIILSRTFIHILLTSHRKPQHTQKAHRLMHRQSHQERKKTNSIHRKEAGVEETDLSRRKTRKEAWGVAERWAEREVLGQRER